jgi:hypothetical protein
MGLFFGEKSMETVMRSALYEMIAAEGAPNAALRESIKLKLQQAEDSPKGKIAWGRLFVSFIITLCIGAAAIFTGLKPELNGLYLVLLHVLELYLGGLLGLITGEAISQR